MNEKAFIFLYPIPEYIDSEIENHSFWRNEEERSSYRQRYQELLNNCIGNRYRQKGFSINYAIFNGHAISDVILLQPTDKIIEVGLDFSTHTTQLPNETYPYPDSDFILDQLGDIQKIIVTGFHLWDCVEKLAKRAYERGLNTLVDEDLTEFLFRRIDDEDFKIDTYPTYNPREGSELLFELFMNARKDKPWLWQNY